MTSLELNKIVGAILVGGLISMVTGLVASSLVQPRHAEVHAVAAPEGAGATAATVSPEPATLEAVGPLLAAADLAAGETAAKKCAACHTFKQGEANKVGPNLWNIVGAPLAHAEGFAYSDALKAKGGTWDYEALNAWLASPKSFIPGNKMAFAGLKKADERANLIAWLRTMSDSPMPLPEPGAAPAPAATEAAAPESTEAAPAAPAMEAPAPETTPAPETPAPVPEEPAAQQAAVPMGGALTDLIKSADPAAGQKSARKCAACHTFDKGGPNKVGPNLWDIVGAKVAHLEDFSYSDALKNLGGEWTYEELDKFLDGPKAYVPGTKMLFPGVKKAEERAAIIAYLRSLSDAPKPLP